VQRDTDEWRRPWTVEDDADAASPTTDRGPQPPRRVIRPTPSTLRVESGVVDRDGTGGEGDAEVPVRTVVVRPGGPGTSATGPESPTTPSQDDAVPGPSGGRRGRGTLAVALVAALLGGVVGAGASLVAADRLDLFEPDGDVASGRASEEDPVRAPVVESVPPVDGATIVSTVAAAVLPSVVRIDVLAEQDDPALGEAVPVQVGVGSGVVYRSDGYLLTNNHVVEDADALEVRFSDGTSATAEIVGTDRQTDLAVLRVDRDGLPAINLRQDAPLEVGETAVAIGSPFGLDASVTAGVVSALNRDLEVPGNGEGAFVIPALIQTDAAINPGNSGGALVDGNGQLIGINTAILTRSGGSQGVGFAIPTRSVVVAAEQLIDRGFVSHPFLGISGLDVTTEVEIRYREEFGIDLDGGALVDQVLEESGAAAAGVQSGDVIVELGGEPIRSMTDVISGILRFDPGDTVDVVVLRDGERLELAVDLGERPR
jgi:S1-C subfamily serine protease